MPARSAIVVFLLAPSPAIASAARQTRRTPALTPCSPGKRRQRELQRELAAQVAEHERLEPAWLETAELLEGARSYTA